MMKMVQSIFARLISKRKSRELGNQGGCQVLSVANCPCCFHKCTTWKWYAESDGGRQVATTTFEPCGCVYVGSEPLAARTDNPICWESVDIRL